jgi:seryl-tRNA synthetase
MPGRGDAGPDGAPKGEYGETHSASRLGDFQCRRLNLRYKDADGAVKHAKDTMHTNFQEYRQGT